MTFQYDRELGAAVDRERGIILRDKRGAYRHKFFEITWGLQVEEFAALSASRDPTPEEKTIYPRLNYVRIWNVLAEYGLFGLPAEETQNLIREGLTVWEANWRDGEPRPSDIVFEDPRYMETGD